MKSLRILATALDRLIWTVGLMTIIIYAQQHWRAAYTVAIGVSLSAFGIWYFWKFFFLPLRAGLRGQ